MKPMISLAPLAVLSLLLLGAAPAGQFDHQAHLLELEDECASCHRPGDLDVVPPLERCLDCHEQGLVDTVVIPGRSTHDSFWYREHGSCANDVDARCNSCHKEPFCFDCHRAGFADEQGRINIHRSDFTVTHPILARSDSRGCAGCHSERFCIDCHRDFAPEELASVSHRRQFRDLSEVPDHELFVVSQCPLCHTDSLLPSHDWSGGHAREARRNLRSCQTCHPEGEVCLTCHSAREGLMVNPHPDDWDDIADKLNGAGDGSSCRRCH